MNTPCLDSEIPAAVAAPCELPAQIDDRPPMAWGRFLSSIGVSLQTGWRWRKLGLIQAYEIAGKPYILASEIERFNRRLASGEFSGVCRTGMVRAGKKGAAA